MSGTLTAGDVNGDALSFILVSNGTKGTAGERFERRNVHLHAECKCKRNRYVHLPASDGTNLSNIATVTVTIEPVNDAPTARTAQSRYSQVRQLPGRCWPATSTVPG